MKRKIREWISISIVKNPARAILFGILLLNLVLLAGAALIISALSPETMEYTGFFDSVFYTVSMILDAGCIQYVVEDIGKVSVTLIIVCLVVILVGMVTFTGATIGYITNQISDFIEKSRSGSRALHVSGHTVILNWNTRASEIINDLLYSGRKETIVVLVPSDAEQVQREIDERVSLTIRTENKALVDSCADKGFFERLRYLHKNHLENKLTVIVREGDTYSLKHLNDISLLQARTVIILGRDIQNTMCKYELAERIDKHEKGNANTVKTLVQVAEITSSEVSADNQVIVVEVDDDWTAGIVDRIIEQKQRLGKCNIVPVPVNHVLGQLLSQFSIMPELNFVYGELFSNKGAEFFCRPKGAYRDENAFIRDTLDHSSTAVPLAIMKTKTGEEEFFVADTETDCDVRRPQTIPAITVKPNRDYWLERRNVVIVGHNSNCKEIMDGFNSFVAEWGAGGRDILNIIVIDDKKNLEKRDYYKEYPYVRRTVEADIYDGEIIKKEITDFVKSNSTDTSILILSDDTAFNEDTDANAMTYLIYVQEVIENFVKESEGFDRESVDVIVEIVDPKNSDVVRNYSVDNVVISNRYVSKMVTQISRKESLYEFYKDILTYDDAGAKEYDSKELYIKKASRFLAELPGPCTAAELIRGIYDATPEDDKAIVIGYVSPGGKRVLFTGDQNSIKVQLTDKDKLIVFSNH